MSYVSSEKRAELEARLLRLGVREEELSEKFIRGGGPGGQKINKTSVAVQLIHLPTKTEVRVQSSRSQATNRFLARRRLAELLEAEKEEHLSKQARERAKLRKQKRRRSKRAKDKVIQAKKQVGEKKRLRQKVNKHGDD